MFNQHLVPGGAAPKPLGRERKLQYLKLPVTTEYLWQGHCRFRPHGLSAPATMWAGSVASTWSRRSRNLAPYGCVCAKMVIGPQRDARNAGISHSSWRIRLKLAIRLELASVSGWHPELAAALASAMSYVARRWRRLARQEHPSWNFLREGCSRS